MSAWHGAVSVDGGGGAPACVVTRNLFKLVCMHVLAMGVPSEPTNTRSLDGCSAVQGDHTITATAGVIVVVVGGRFASVCCHCRGLLVVRLTCWMD